MITRLALPDDVFNARAWMAARQLPDIPADLFSSTGYVAPGLAAVWLYLTDSRLAFLELLVSNPEAPKRQRRAALDAVVARAVSEARLADTRLLTCCVQREDVERLGERQGFSSLGTVRMLANNLQGVT